MKKYITTILTILATIAPIAIYANSHRMLYTIPALAISIVLILSLILLRKWSNVLYISPYIILIALIIMLYILANSYANFFFYTYPTLAPIHKSAMTRFNIDFTKSLLLSASMLFLYISSSYFVGKQIIKKLGNIFTSTLVGLSIYSSIFFTFAAFGILNPYTSLFSLILPTVINTKKILIILKKFIKYLNTGIEINLNIKRVVLIIPAILFICSFIVISLTSFITGPDGLRFYLVLTKHLAETGGLPITKFTTYSPFFTETLLSPAYMLGQTETTKFLLNFLSISSIFGFYLIAKDFIKSKSDYLLLFVIFLYPSHLKIFASEFKIDIILILYASAVFYCFYEFLKTKKTELIYLMSYFMGVSIIIKLTSLYYILPIGVFVLIQILSTKIKLIEKGKQLLLILLIGVIPILPWVTFYKISAPGISELGLGISKYSNYETVEKNVDTCLFSQKEHEEAQYFKGYENNLKGLTKLPYYYLKAGDNSIFSLLDAGIFFIMAVSLYFSYLIFKRSQIIKDKNLRTITILMLVSWAVWLKTAPVYIWYIGPTLILTTFILYVSFLKNANDQIKNYLKAITFLFSLIYIFAFSTQFMFVHFAPTGLNPSDVVKIYGRTRDYRAMYYSQSVIGPILNKDKNSYILLSSGTGFANIGFFIDNYLDRAIYLDLYTKTFSKEEIEKIVNEYNIEYIVVNRVAVDSNLECLSKNQKIALENINQIGKTLITTPTFYLVKVKG